MRPFFFSAIGSIDCISKENGKERSLVDGRSGYVYMFVEFFLIIASLCFIIITTVVVAPLPARCHACHPWVTPGSRGPG